MNDLTPQLKEMMENAKRVSLSRAEKDAMRAHVKAFVRAYPKRGGLIPSPWVAGRFLMIVHKPAMALVLLLVLGGGTAYAAEGALPGDTLYPVKVDVIEEVVAAVTISDEARVRWDVRRAERRLEEAATLAAAGRMTAEAEVEIEQRFEHFAEAVEQRTKRVEKKKGPRAAAALLAEFEGKLRGHERLLARADQETPAATRAAAPLQAEEDMAADIEPALMMATMPVEVAPSKAGAGTALMIGAAVADDDGAGEGRREHKQRDAKDSSPLVKKVRERLEKLERVRVETELEADLGDRADDLELDIDDDDPEILLPET